MQLVWIIKLLTQSVDIRLRHTHTYNIYAQPINRHSSFHKSFWTHTALIPRHISVFVWLRCAIFVAIERKKLQFQLSAYVKYEAITSWNRSAIWFIWLVGSLLLLAVLFDNHIRSHAACYTSNHHKIIECKIGKLANGMNGFVFANTTKHVDSSFVIIDHRHSQPKNPK